MKVRSKFAVLFGVTGWLLSNAWGGPAPTAIQAIQQGSDPSALVAAFANGVAVDGNNPKLYEAYISRMVDLGLPELAYHQAQTLTTLQSNNGLAWGVVAYVDARRGDMPEAISAINLAGQAAPKNVFVQRTAGEIVAWYDLQADKAKLPDNEKDGLSKVRALLEKESAFALAYNTAKDAYRAQANAPQSSGEAAAGQYQYGADQNASAAQSQVQGDQVAPLGYAPVASSSGPDDSDYYYDWGPNWVQPAPWWWWQPVGFFGGCSFFPFSTVVLFNNAFFFAHHHFFHHDKFFHDHGFNHGHDGSFHHDGLNVAFHDSNHAFFHRDGQSAFFGTAARPNSSLTVSTRGNSHPSGSASGNLGLRSGTPGLMNSSAVRSSMPSMNMRRANNFVSRGTIMTQRSFNTSRGNSRFVASMPMRSGVMPRSVFRMPAFRGGVPAQGRQAGFAVPHMSPRAMPMNRGFAGGGFRGASGPSGGFHGGGGFGGGHR